jgi:tRNA A-37 threonylcarbamoyl transferase component Bud32
MGNERGDDGADATSPRFSLDVAGVPSYWADTDPPDLIAGRYEVARLIGSGGTARVYRAVDRLLRREVAIKVYERHAVAVEQLRRVRERTVQARIDHPRVVALFDSGAEGGRPYLVMQLVDGEDLAERLLAGPLGADDVAELASKLAEALAHVHAQRVVHRDLKPANILLGPDGPLISDFGIAHELDSTHITGTGLVTGTAAYLAPEQIVGEPAEPAADIYALGLILLECLTGEREYPGTLAESATARLHRSPRIPAGLPAPLAHTLSRMTAREPADRPAAEQVPRLLRESVGVVAAVPTRRRWALMAAGGLTTAAAAVVLAVVVARPDVPANSPARLPAAEPPVTSTSGPAVSPAHPASDVVAASPRAADPSAPSLVTAVPPSVATGGSPGGVDVESGKTNGKAKGQDKGKGKGRNEP